MSLPRRLCFATALCLALPAAAQEGQAEQDALREEAAAIRTAAEKQWRQAQSDCLRRYFVQSCLDAAQEARLAEIERARALEQQATRMDLAAKRLEAAARDARAEETLQERRTSAPAQAAPAAPFPDGEADDAPAAPVPDGEADDAQATALRREREREAARAEHFADEMRSREDAAREADRRAHEAEAQERAERARRDRARYDARLREYRQKHPDQPSPTLPE